MRLAIGAGTKSAPWWLIAVLTVLAAIAAVPLRAQTLAITPIFAFGPELPTGTSLDGSQVWGQLLDSGNPSVLLYGATATGGENNTGAIFSVDGFGNESVLYSFSPVDPSTGENADGDGPYDPLISDGAGGFYGTTHYGGASGDGVIFDYTSSGQLVTLFSFPPVADGTNEYGANPNAIALGPDGRLYGTTQNGGANGAGVVFAFDMSDSGMTVLHAFTKIDLDNLTNRGDGSWPVAGLTLANNGLFYGGTASGGKHGYGVLFSITPWGTFTPLRAFQAYTVGTLDNADGVDVAGMVLGPDGALYGANYGGGSGGNGVIFRLSTSGDYTVLHNFQSTGTQSSIGLGWNCDGAQPSVPRFGSDGFLYGTTSAGGLYGYGTVYRMAADGTCGTFVSLTSCQEGLIETGLTPCVDGNLYGASALGGPYGDGSIFAIDPISTTGIGPL
jgi:uncharacterized repeat protein (TIGR03803 family)